MTRTVAVTGASGFLGRHVCQVLARRGHQVIGIGHQSSEPPADLREVVADWTAWDMTKPGTPPVPTRASAIVHLAQSPRFREFPAGARDMFDVNLRSTFELLEAARLSGIARFVYVSSGAVYGESGERRAPAEQPILGRPDLGFYAMTKLASELFAKTYDSLLFVSILRLFFPYGPGQQADRLLPRLIQNVAARQPLKLQGEHGLTFNPIYVSDAAEAVARAVDAEGAVTLDIAGRESVSLRQLGEMIGKAVRQAPLFEVNRDQASPTLLGDSPTMSERLEFTPVVGLTEGIARTAADLLAQSPA